MNQIASQLTRTLMETSLVTAGVARVMESELARDPQVVELVRWVMSRVAEELGDALDELEANEAS